jgi:hypothetical protein
MVTAEDCLKASRRTLPPQLLRNSCHKGLYIHMRACAPQATTLMRQQFHRSEQGEQKAWLLAAAHLHQRPLRDWWPCWDACAGHEVLLH